MLGANMENQRAAGQVASLAVGAHPVATLKDASGPSRRSSSFLEILQSALAVLFFLC